MEGGTQMLGDRRHTRRQARHKNSVNKVLMACLYGTSGTADKVPDIILQY